MENQSPNLNALSRLPMLSLRIDKSRMRHPPRSPIRLRIKALNQHHLVRSLAIRIVPLMRRARFYGIQLPYAIRVDERHPDEIAVRDGVGVGDGQWVLVYGLDGSPYIDDLDPAL